MPAPNRIPATYAARLRSLRRRLDAAGADVLLVTYAPDQFYLTGAVLEDSVVLVTSRKVIVLTDSRFDEQVALQAPWADKALRDDSLPDAIIRTAADLRVRRIGLDEYMLVGQYDLLKAKAGKLRLKITRGLVASLRVAKNDAEVATIVKAIRVAEQAYLATAKTVKPGLREQEVAAELEYQMRLAGASGSAFEPIVATAARSSLPHARAGETRIRAGQPLLFDWGARVDGYCSDLTRVLTVGAKLPPKIAQIYPIVLEAQLAGIAAIRPGAKCRDVDGAARKIITDAGFGPQFGHGLGHGIGLDVHERPRLGAKSGDVLKPGMIVTVEPGIYLPGVGGVRIEDDVLVTKTSHRVLSRLPK
ncbi:MAG: aminopeptidase P family protein [Phycisphaerae bacterium]|nr:aminopeptidase P family protein [Phycisphaerae bacterium]